MPTTDTPILLKRDLRHEVSTTLAAYIAENAEGHPPATLADITATILAGRDYEGHGDRRNSGFLIRPKLLPEAVLATFAGAGDDCSYAEAAEIARQVNECGGVTQASRLSANFSRDYILHLRAERVGQRAAA